MEALPSVVINHRRKNEPNVAPIIEMPELSNKLIVQESERSD